MTSSPTPNLPFIPLSGLRVLEVAEMLAAPYCGKLLASLGADVVKVEPPVSGDPARRQGPFPGDVPHPERSGLFLYLNTGKRGVTLNLQDPQGRAMLAELAANADALIHDRQPKERDTKGLDTETLADANPGLIVASVTPFGGWGPYAGYRAHDVNVFHAGGEGWLLPNGLALDTFPDRAPIAAGSQMGSYQGGLTAALGVAAAVYAQANGSPGQSVDCSMQEAQLSLGYVPIQRLEEEGIVEDRFARYFRIGGVLPAQDGYVEMLTLEPGQWQGLSRMLGDPDWATLENFQNPGEQRAEINAHLREWFSSHNKEWLYRGGPVPRRPHRPLLHPRRGLPQPAAARARLLRRGRPPRRGPLRLRRAALPGRRRSIESGTRPAPWRTQPGSLRAAWLFAGRYSRAGPRRSDLTDMAEDATHQTDAKNKGPLSGVRVADFSVHAAGPFAGLMLAELGAQVIKIESSARLDITRRPHTMYGKPPSGFEQVNANKMSITLNLKEPRAVELALELVRLSDMVLENFRPRRSGAAGAGIRPSPRGKTRPAHGVHLGQRTDRTGAGLLRLRPHVRRRRGSGFPHRLS